MTHLSRVSVEKFRRKEEAIELIGERGLRSAERRRDFGVLLGAASFNPLTALMLSGMGIARPEFPVDPLQAAALGVGLVLLATLLLALASRTQRIAPSELVRA